MSHKAHETTPGLGLLCLPQDTPVYVMFLHGLGGGYVEIWKTGKRLAGRLARGMVAQSSTCRLIAYTALSAAATRLGCSCHLR